ncbi:MAG: EAL domain-containing protein [Methylovirgula sp.]|nr:EAL domain-containing protein [Methylovirgula sp.]
MKRSGVLTKLRITVGEIDLPALQIWVVANFVSMALILILGIRLGYLLFTSHADFFSWKFLGAALAANAWLIAAAVLARIIMVGMAYRVVGALRSSEARARQVAGRDVLSGLPNRFLFNELVDAEIARCRRGRHQFALFYLDLDHFKQANDTFGHDVGDRLIVAFTRRLAQVLRACDHFARLGGDEFALIQADVIEPRDCARLAQRILDAMSVPFEINNQQIFIGVSMGIALCPQNASDRQELMRLADLALYRSKQAGRNRFAFFEAKMGEELRMRQSAEDELRAAIENDELQLLYQPILAAEDGKIICVEALARWQHRTYGLLSADSFIPLAEERGLIVALGEWALRRACTEAKLWTDVKVAINVSPIQFRQKDFVASVDRILTETGLDPQRVEFELTEGVVIADADLAERAMIDLRALGVRMVLDDFGTGYSSLIYLRRFAFDKIKIDRSFMESMEFSGESAIIIRSIVDLGRSLGLTVTAEGVETEEQARFLRALGCDELQGYLFGRPMPADEIEQRLAEQRVQCSPPEALHSIA